MGPRTWAALTFVLIVVGTLVQLGGLLAPMWIWLELSDFHVGVGLYFRDGCGSDTGGVCNHTIPALPFGYTDADTSDRDHWVHLIWLETWPACMGVMLTIMMLVYLAGMGKWKWIDWLNTAMVGVAIFTWLPISAGLVVFAVFHGTVITRSPDISTQSFPWSALMCFLAGIIFVIVTILIRVRCRIRRYVKHAVPSSADSKMALNPSTKSQLINRYFTPSPYTEDRRHALQSNVYHTNQNQLHSNGVASRALEHGGQGVDNRAAEFNEDGRRNTVEFNRHQQQVHVNGNVPYSFENAFRREDVPPYFTKTTGLQKQQQQQQQQQQEVVKTTTTISHVKAVAGDRRVTQTDRLHRPQIQPHSTDVGRTMTTQENRVVAHEVVLDRHGQLQGFDDATEDMETIYYTGNIQESSHPFHTNSNAFNKDTLVARSALHHGHSNGYIEQGGSAMMLSHHEKVPDDIDHNLDANAEQKSYRLPAGQVAHERLGQNMQLTVHTRNLTNESRGDKVLLIPEELPRSNFKYNSTYIYRPYSEQVY